MIHPVCIHILFLSAENEKYVTRLLSSERRIFLLSHRRLSARRPLRTAVDACSHRKVKCVPDDIIL